MAEYRYRSSAKVRKRRGVVVLIALALVFIVLELSSFIEAIAKQRAEQKQAILTQLHEQNLALERGLRAGNIAQYEQAYAELLALNESAQSVRWLNHPAIDDIERLRTTIEQDTNRLAILLRLRGVMHDFELNYQLDQLNSKDLVLQLEAYRARLDELESDEDLVKNSRDYFVALNKDIKELELYARVDSEEERRARLAEQEANLTERNTQIEEQLKQVIEEFIVHE